MTDYKELIKNINDCLIAQPSEAVYKRMMNDYKELIGDIKICLIAQPNQTLYKQLLREAADAIVQLAKERDSAVDDLEKCMHYAQPKNNNVCNFCKKDMSEYPDKCNGWSDFCKCEPEWRGVQEEELD